LRRIKVLDWPACSPDLNPIEHVWALLKVEVRKLRDKSGENSLRKLITDVWHSPAFEAKCIVLIASMPARILACVEAKGGPTKY
jgi:hypothetical protein